MHRRVDVRSTVRAEGVGRQRQLVALSHILEKIELQRRVPLVDGRPRRIERRCHVDPSRRAQSRRALLAGRAPDDQAEQQCERQTCHANDRLGDGPCLQCLLHGHVEELLDEPETGIIHVREYQRARAGREHEQLGAGPRGRHRDRRDYPRARCHRHSRRAGRHPDQRRDGPGEQEWRGVRSARHVGDRFAYATFQQHPIEATAGADYQKNGGGRREAVVRELEDLHAREALPVSQRPKGKQQCYEQRNDRAADEIYARAKPARAVERDIGCARADHQDHGKQHREERDPEARHFYHHAAFAAHAARELRSDWVVRGQLNPWRDPRAEDRAGQRRRRQPDEECIRDRAPDLGFVSNDRQHRRRMRRHHAMHHRQSRHEGNTDLHQ